MSATAHRVGGGRIARLRGIAALAAFILAGCASYDGSGLIAGTSTAADVESSMGRPDDKRTAADGSHVWFYTRPSGGHNFAVQLGPDGIVRGVENRLTEENIAKLEAGISRRADVGALLGPPHFVLRLDRQQRAVWAYHWVNVTERMQLWVQFSDDGLAREILISDDYDYLPASKSEGKD